MKQSNANPLILVDGSSYLYRAFHAMPSLTNSKGEPTGAIYGVINMLRRLLTDYKPEEIVVVFDAKGKTFRDDLYKDYKAHRPPMPAELAAQIAPIHAIIQALGIPLLVEEGVEADDVIGTLAKHAENKGIPTIVSTGDKDFAQLVNHHIRLINTMTDTELTPDSVVEKFGVPPERIVDWLTLVGDSVDNIPGVPNVGPKTATKWLNEYGSLDKIIQHADQIKGKVGENLRAHLEKIPLTKQLVTIKTDVELNLSPDALKRKTADTEKLNALYRKYEFKSWLNELLEKNSSASEKNDKHENYKTIFTENDLSEWLKRLEKSRIFAFDTETTSLNYMDAELVGVSFSDAPGQAAYIPLTHNEKTKQLNREFVLQQLKPVLENNALKKIGHNLKYDYEILARYDIHLSGIAFDTMIESAVRNSASNNHDMDSLALKYLGWRTITFEDIAGKGAKQITFDHVPIDKAATYAAEDADVTLQLHNVLWPELSKEPGLKKTFEEIEMPLIPVIARMERNGVLIDCKKLEKQSEELEKRLMELEKEAYTLADCEFNMNSPKQLQEILYDKLQLPILQKTPKGQPSTAENVLQELAESYPFPKSIIEYRGLSKLMNTYTRRLPEQINETTGRVHTSYHQMGAATGRLSSSNPNLQNIPIRTHEGRRIRQAFIAPKGHYLISADYSQIELRIMAHISEDPTLLKAFENNLDIHQATAAEVLGIPLERVTSEERRAAKAINFGLIYGMSAFGLAKQLGVDRQTAQKYIDRYFERYPMIQHYMENTRKKAHAEGFVETLWGRRLYLPDINSSQIMRQKASERMAINGPLQGSAADIIKRAMIAVDAWLIKNNSPTKLIMQVHDELVLEVPEKNIDEITEMLRTHMMSAAKLKVPLSVNIGIGHNWDEASK
ncbi:MAG: DNA polymerase I [Gammaproteobacteria bacterium]|nr:DNA polymerase I [Gammaproteobacteria bacterium]